MEELRALTKEEFKPMCLDAALYRNNEKDFWKRLMINLRRWYGDLDPTRPFVLKRARGADG